jgi:hypothetical protein
MPGLFGMYGSVGRPVHIFDANVMNNTVHSASPPAGRAWIITDIDVFFTGAVIGGSLNLELPSGNTFYSKDIAPGEPSESDHWTGFHCLQPGEYVVIQVANGPYDVLIDGWEVPWANV